MAMNTGRKGSACSSRPIDKALVLIAVGAFALFAEIGTSAPVPPVEYVFVEDTQRTVGILRGQRLLIGYLNSNGTFVETSRQSRNGFLSPAPLYTLLNPQSLKPRQVYEFRARRLIKGALAPEGEFTPEIGSKVISFNDYQYSPSALPIWNLPGYFVPKKSRNPEKAREQSPPR